MSLRRDVHVAFDQIAPPLGGMPERVVQTVLAEHMARRRKERMLLRFRAPLSLVAVLLMVAFVALLLMSGRLYQSWNAFHNTPANPSSTQIAQLEARPLHLPVFKSQSTCINGPMNAEGSFGAGPLFLGERFSSWSSSWGYYYDYPLYADQRIAGPILVRVRDLFTPDTVLFVGQYAAGPVVGTDVIDGSSMLHRSELLLAPSEATANIAQGKSHPFVWNITAAAAINWSGSSGWQIDGPGFSEVFAAC